MRNYPISHPGRGTWECDGYAREGGGKGTRREEKTGGVGGGEDKGGIPPDRASEKVYERNRRISRQGTWIDERA
jgi:hypothetical protein